MRLIDADALEYEEAYLNGHYEFGDIEIITKRKIEAAPTISPDEVRGVGEWEDANQHGLCGCSVCKDCYIEKWYIKRSKWKFCPNCGANMRGGNQDA